MRQHDALFVVRTLKDKDEIMVKMDRIDNPVKTTRHITRPVDLLIVQPVGSMTAESVPLEAEHKRKYVVVIAKQGT